MLVLSAVAFGFTQWTKQKVEEAAGSDVDFTRIQESNGVICTTVSGCEIRVVCGRLQDHPIDPGTAVVLPCNEYFDDECAADTRSALGAYVNSAFEGRVDGFISLVKQERAKRLGQGRETQKTEVEKAFSYGAGRCLLLLRPPDRSAPIALVSTTTQRASQGLAARISYLFDGMSELVERLADARILEVAMPILGAGHGGIDPPLAFVGLILAIAEAARYGQGGQRLNKVTIVVFKRESDPEAQVGRTVIRRALALVGSRD